MTTICRWHQRHKNVRTSCSFSLRVFTEPFIQLRSGACRDTSTGLDSNWTGGLLWGPPNIVSGRDKLISIQWELSKMAWRALAMNNRPEVT